MRRLRRTAEQEPGRLAVPLGLRRATAIGLTTTAAVLVFLGLNYQYSSVNAAPSLLGMDHLWGQIGWSVAFGTTMIIASWLVRHVIMGRLQWAIVASLLLHLLLVVTIQHLQLEFQSAQSAQASPVPGSDLEELTLPDYGGMESALETPEWERPDRTPVPEIQRNPLQRQKHETDIELEHERRQVDRDRQIQVAKLEPMQRQQADEVHQQDTKPEIQRQAVQQPAENPESVESPQLQTRAVEKLKLEARAKTERTQALPSRVERDRTSPQLNELNLRAAEIQASRSEPSPRAAPATQADLKSRRIAAARGVTRIVERDRSAVTKSAPKVTAAEREFDATRHVLSRLPVRDSASDGEPFQPRSPAVARLARSRTDSEKSNSLEASPSSGGSISIVRKSSQPVAVGSTVESVQVRKPSGGSAPMVLESDSAIVAGRRNGPSIPSANREGQRKSPGPGSPIAGSSSPVALTNGAAANDQIQPQLVGDRGVPAKVPDGAGRDISAVGTEAELVTVPTTGSVEGPASHDGSFESGPSGTGISRRATQLPSKVARRGTGTSAMSSGESQPGRISGTTGSQLAGRTTEPSAHLEATDDFTRGTKRGLPRASMVADLAPAAVQAEQTGALVVAGPQSVTTLPGLFGTTRASIRRRSAALPGAVGPSPPRAATPGDQTLPVKVNSSDLAGGRQSSNGPALPARNLLARLVKQAAPGKIVEADISPAFSMRKENIRQKVTETLGGSDQSEKAVEAGLQWLARHQHTDGRWSIHQFQLQCRDHQCTGHGSFDSDTAATGLALLAFYGAGYTQQEGRHQESVARGLRWLVDQQKPDGDLFSGKVEFVWLYSHGMAAIVLCEAYGMTKDANLRDPAEKALQFIIDSQHTDFGGWRYRPRFESDTSVSGWQVMALKSGEMAGLRVPQTVYDGVGNWLDSVESKKSPGHFAYHPTKPASLAMTAEGLLMRQYLGSRRDDAKLKAGADYLQQHLPQLESRDVYYWYYATQVMFHMQGEYWENWNDSLRDQLVNTQLKEGGPAGSWSPDRPTRDKWDTAGGRLYVTCLNLLMLEVYYRHLPLYLQLDE